MHSEAKQTETSELGAEKSLLQGGARIGGLCPKHLELPEGFQQSIFFLMYFLFFFFFIISTFNYYLFYYYYFFGCVGSPFLCEGFL